LLFIIAASPKFLLLLLLLPLTCFAVEIRSLSANGVKRRRKVSEKE
jgi:hypothetical protein